MADNTKARTIRFSHKLWAALDAEAKKCGRSPFKQMEMIMLLYFGLSNAEIDSNRLQKVKAAIEAGDTLTREVPGKRQLKAAKRSTTIAKSQKNDNKKKITNGK